MPIRDKTFVGCRLVLRGKEGTAIVLRVVAQSTRRVPMLLEMINEKTGRVFTDSVARVICIKDVLDIEEIYTHNLQEVRKLSLQLR